MISRFTLCLTLGAWALVGCSDKSDADSTRPTSPDTTTTDDTGTSGVDTDGTDTATSEPTDTATTDTTEPTDTSVTDDTGTTDTDTGGPPPTPDVSEFGFEEDRTLVLVGSFGDGLQTPRDLKFHPERDELWVMNRYGADSTVDGSSHIIWFAPESPKRYAEFHSDVYAYHFMAHASSMAFGEALYSGSSEVNFATCHESRNDYGGSSPPNDFMGPALWNSDLRIYGAVNQTPASGLGGSHLDMLHQSPLCMGMVYETGNAYWVFDGDAGNLVRYDFADDHDAGHDDHSDGVVRRYPEAEVTRVADVPGHMAYYGSRLVLVADPGAGRVLSIDVHTGSFSRNLSPYGERLAEYSEYTGADVQVVIDGLDTPSGLALSGDTLFISDNATGEIIAFDLDEGVELGRMETGATGLGALAVSPTGLLWFIDTAADELRYIQPE